MMNTFWSYNTQFGRVTIESDGASITRVCLGDAQLEGEARATALTNAASTQLQEYLAGKRRLFDLPLKPAGTAFQKEVWRALEMIPYGETRTYAQVAEYLGRPGAARAVGSANRANPIPIIIPCHRVVPASGGIGGYAYGERVKELLLQLEQKNS